MTSLIIVILGYILVVWTGKSVYGKNKPLGIALVMFITALQVVLLLNYLYSVEMPLAEP